LAKLTGKEAKAECVVLRLPSHE